jgi:hypothetical protein
MRRDAAEGRVCSGCCEQEVSLADLPRGRHLSCDDHSLTGLKNCKRNTKIYIMDLAADGLSATAQLEPWLARWLDQAQNAAP